MKVTISVIKWSTGTYWNETRCFMVIAMDDINEEVVLTVEFRLAEEVWKERVTSPSSMLLLFTLAYLDSFSII